MCIDRFRFALICINFKRFSSLPIFHDFMTNDYSVFCGGASLTGIKTKCFVIVGLVSRDEDHYWEEIQILFMQYSACVLLFSFTSFCCYSLHLDGANLFCRSENCLLVLVVGKVVVERFHYFILSVP